MLRLLSGFLAPLTRIIGMEEPYDYETDDPLLAD